MYVRNHRQGGYYNHQNQNPCAPKKLNITNQGQTPDCNIWRRNEKKSTDTNARKTATLSDKENRSTGTVPDYKMLKSDTVSEIIDI